MATISSTEPTNFIDKLSQNAITLGIAIYLIVIAYYMTKDPEKLFTNIYLYSTIAIVPINAVPVTKPTDAIPFACGIATSAAFP